MASFVVYVLVVLIFVNLYQLSSCGHSTPLVYPHTCQNGQYFHRVLLKCVPCSIEDDRGIDNRFNPANSSYDYLKSTDGSSCICKSGFRTKRRRDGVTVDCIRCPSKHVTSLDGSSCVQCSDKNPFDVKTNSCSACLGGILEEKFDGNIVRQYCVSCPDNTVADGTQKECISCYNGFVKGENGTGCVCPEETHRAYGGVCIPIMYSLPENHDLYTVTYGNYDEHDSSYFHDNLQSAAYNCRYFKNHSACQILGNLCVLRQYSYYLKMDYKKNACNQFLLVPKSQSLPWLYYQDDANVELFKSDVSNQYSVNSKLRLVAARYDGKGNLIEVSELKPGELQLCKGSDRVLNSGFTFGTNYQQVCRLDSLELWNKSPKKPEDLTFFDLFLLNDDDEGKSVSMYPIPILIENMDIDGDRINVPENEDKWKLVRRFFLIDGVTGYDSHSTDSEQQIKYVRVAKKLSLEVKLRQSEGLIYPPLVTIKYTDLTLEDYQSNTEQMIEFSISYIMDHWTIYRDISIAIGVISIIFELLALLRTWSWAKRAGKEPSNPAALGKFVFISCGYLSNAFTVVVIGAALNWFVIYKQQSVIHSLLPSPKQEKMLEKFLIAAVILKLFSVVHDLVVLCNVDIFFIDWEKPKIRGPKFVPKEKSQNGPTGGATEKPMDANGNTSSPNRKNIASIQEKILSEFPAVSIWRTYFVANEWVELCGHRQLDLGLHLFLILLVLSTLGFENLAIGTTTSNFSLTESLMHVQRSWTCRIAVGSCVYITMAFAQIAFKKLFYQKVFKDKIQEFVDLCSVSNISMFCFVAKTFGYYIHGRSPNGMADVSMKEMHELLKREEDDLCSRRGLLPNTDQQTFEMALPATVHEQYQRIRNLLTSYSQGADRMQGVGGKLFKVDIEKVVPTYHAINKFLSGFIEHVYKDVDYVVKDKTTVEMLLDTEFSEPSNKGFFYNENGRSYEALLLSGIEVDLCVLELLLFLVLDMLFKSFLSSAIFTYLIAKVMQHMYLNASRKNIVRKALIDERFLV